MNARTKALLIAGSVVMHATIGVMQKLSEDTETGEFRYSTTEAMAMAEGLKWLVCVVALAWQRCGARDGLPDYAVDDQVALWLVYPKSNVLTAKVRVFIDFLIERVGDAPGWDTG